TYDLGNQLEFIQGRIPAVMVHLLHVGFRPTAIFGRRCTSPTNANRVELLFADGLDAFEADLRLPQIAEIIFVKKALVNAEMELGKKFFPRVGPERGAAHPAQPVLLATNHETMEVKVAPIECDLEQLV